MAKSANYNGTLVSDECFEGDVIDREMAKSSSPEVELWLAVVERVWEDAFVSSNISIQSTDRRCASDLVRAEARRWLLLDHGTWKTDRETVCGQAGIDPDVIHRAAVRRNELAKGEDQERNRREREAIDRAMSRLVERAPDMKLGRINRAMRELADRELALA